MSAPTITRNTDGSLSIVVPEPRQTSYPCSPEVMEGWVETHNELLGAIHAAIKHSCGCLGDTLVKWERL